jgi:uncharacterized protein YkwD
MSRAATYATCVMLAIMTVALSGCPSSGGITPTPGLIVQHGDPSVTAGEQAMLDRHDNTRAGAGAGALTANALLCQIAQDQANYLADTGQLTHEDASGGHAWDRANAVGYSYSQIAENVAYDQTADAVYTQWLNSSGHYDNIVNPIYTEVGVGVATRDIYQYWCVVFATP